MSKLVFERPTSQTPGYLRRAKAGLEFKARMASGVDPIAIDDMVEFLLTYVTEPVDRDEARETLLDATEEQFSNLINAVIGEDLDAENPTVPETPLASSEPSEKAEKE